jgi:hypothetical protein
VRSNHSRQTRRSGLCHRVRRPRGRKRAISPGRVALTAYGFGVSEFASYLADEIELSNEITELLSVDLSVAVHRSHGGRTLERELQVLAGGVRDR